jgi:hypothetical protein
VIIVDDAARKALLRRGFALEFVTLGGNVIGVVVLAITAIAVWSVPLAGFELDSFIGAARSLAGCALFTGAGRGWP